MSVAICWDMDRVAGGMFSSGLESNTKTVSGPAGDPICCLLTGLSETGHDRPVGVGRHIGHRMSSLDNPFVQKCGANGAECHLQTSDTRYCGVCSLHMQTERSKYLGLLGRAHLTDGITHSGKEGAIVGRPALQVWQSHLLFPLV